MARTPNTETKSDRLERHKAKMAGKKLNREHGLVVAGFTPSFRTSPRWQMIELKKAVRQQRTMKKINGRTSSRAS